MESFPDDLLPAVAMARAKGPPKVRSAELAPNSAVIAGFSAYAASQKIEPKGDQVKFCSTASSSIMHTEIIPNISALKPTNLRTVCKAINQITTGAVLFAKVVGPAAFRLNPHAATNMLIQDENSDYMVACIYNFVRPDQDPAFVFSTGTFLAFLQPYMKFAMDDPNQNLMLRCDNPLAIRIFNSEIEWLQRQRKKIPQALAMNQPPATDMVSDLRSRGNEAYRANRINEAIDLYSEAVSLAESAGLPIDVLIPVLLNRAQCFIQQELGQRALDDVTRVLVYNPKNQKGLHRRIRALLLLPGRLKEVIATCTNLEEGPVLRQLLSDVRSAIAESQGDFDEQALVCEAQQEPDCRISRKHPDFFASDLIGIEAAGCSGGRGIIAKSDLPADTLLMATRAFCSTTSSDQIDSAHLYALDPYRRTYDTGRKAALAPRALQSLLQMTEAERIPFFSLTSGPMEAGPDDAAALNVQRIKLILKYNCFGREDYAHSEVSEACQRIEVSSKVGRLITAEEWRELGGSSRASGCGLWILPSLINHSCCPNTRINIIGDFMFVRNMRPVAKGEEISVSYVDINLPMAERAAKISAGWGFTCACERCQLCRARPEIVEMEAEVLELLRACEALKAEGKGFKPVLGAGRLEQVERAWSGIPDSCKPLLASLMEAKAGLELEQEKPAASLAWSQRQDALCRASGAMCDPHNLQRNQLFQAGRLLELGRREEATARVARSRALCGAWLGAPSESAQRFVAMCHTYSCICDPGLQAAMEAMAAEVDAAYSKLRRASRPRPALTVASVATALEKARCCVLPSIPSAVGTSAPISPDQPHASVERVGCAGCGARAAATAPLLRCTGCRQQWYCSRACQRADWPDHKGGCKALAGEQGRHPP